MIQPELAIEEQLRYSRQIGAGVLSAAGQVRLKHSSVLVTRAGGMGGPAAMAIVMAGVGRVTIAHGGNLESPDLNRQLLGSEAGLGQPRAPVFADALRSMNRFVQIDALGYEPDDEQAWQLAREVDCILSCAPTFAERLRLNAAAVAAGVPLIDAAQWGMTGTLIAVDPGRTACLRCLYPENPPFEELFPVVGAISSAIGSLAGLEAIKILSGSGQPIFGKLWVIDGYRGGSTLVALTRNSHCPCCSET